jgi:hypothetical protein
MNIVTNHKLIKRNRTIGNVANVAGIVILGAGAFFSFRSTTAAEVNPMSLNLLLVAMLVGFIIIQVGAYYMNRWGRSPRPDELIDKGLKGMGREYTVYHYSTPAYHFLLGPAGLWVIVPYHQPGKVTYAKKRWRIRGGGAMQNYLRIFGQEGLGRPDLESGAETDSITRYLSRTLPEGNELPPVKSMLLFLNPKVELELEDPPIPALLLKDLKDFLREQAKGKPVSATTLEAIRQALPKPD